MIIEEMFEVEPEKDSLFCVKIVEGESLVFTRYELELDTILHAGYTSKGVIEEFRKIKEGFTNRLAFKDRFTGETHEILVHPKKFTNKKNLIMFVCVLPESTYSGLKIGDICD